MTPSQMKALGEGIGVLVRDAVQSAVGGLERKFTSMIDALPTAKDGINGRDGKDAEVSDDRIAKAVARYLTLNPIQTPRDGRDGVDGRDGRDGKDIGISDDAAVGAAVAKYFAGNPLSDGRDGKDGRDGIDGQKGIDGKDGARGLDGEDGRDGKDGKDGADGINGKDGAAGRDGTDGEPGANGLNGKDGRDGINGKDGERVTVAQVLEVVEPLVIKEMTELVEKHRAQWELDAERRAVDFLQRAIDRIPLPRDGKDGSNGKDGRDALDFDNLRVEQSEDLKTATFIFERGSDKFEYPVKLRGFDYQEVWQAEKQYERGNFVTYDGSMWACLRDTTSKPGQFNKDWRLAVKRGRNGKSGDE